MRPDFPFRPAQLPFFYGWVVLVVTTLGVLCSIPGQTMGVSVFTDPLLEATGLSRLAFSNAYLVGTLASGLGLSWGGRWLDRFGVRRTIFAACLALAATLLYLSVSDRLAARLAGGLGAADTPAVAWAVLAVGFTALRFSGQGMLTLASRTTLARWFVRRRGLVSALSGAVVNFGFAGAPLGLQLWIDLAGWRGAWQGMALVVGVGMGVVGLLLYRHDPEECGLRPDGDPPLPHEEGQPAPTEARADGVPELDRRQALRTAAFWLVTLGIASHAMVGTGLTFHIVDLGAEAGLTEAQAVAIFLPIALLSTPTGFLAGAAIDRFPVRFLMVAMMVSEIAMYAGMAYWEIPAMRWVAVAGWGLSSGCFGPLTVAALPAFFGRRHLGEIQGAQMTALVLASALGPAVLVLFRDLFGSYRPGLLLLCALPAAVALVAPFTRSPRKPPIR
ncbi:MAG: MFS transporter [Myxococcota bacterium]